MEIKLIVSDLDGTLLTNKKTISEYNKQMIRTVKEKGIKFCIASGRPYKSIQQIINKNRLDDLVDYIIGYNGYILLDIDKNYSFTEEKLSVDEIEEIIAITRNDNFNVIQYDGDELYALYEDNVTKRIETYKPCKCHIIGVDFFNKPLEKILITNDISILNQFYQRHKMDNKSYKMVKGNTDLIEFMKNNISKGKTLLKLLEYSGINSNQVLAFGDQDNDLELLDSIKYSVAMGNSEQHIKDVCWSTCLTNEENGVGSFIDEFIIESK